MSINRVPASAAIDWIRGGIDYPKRWPAVFLVMGLITAIIFMIPFLGGLAALILGPALIGGTVAAAYTADRGGQPAIGQLFQAFQGGDRLGAMIALCIPTVVAALILAVLLFIFGLGAALGGGANAASGTLSSPGALFAVLGASMLILIPVSIVLMLAAYAYTFFAIPRLMLGNGEAFPAMRESFAACRANLGAFILTCVLLVVGLFVVAFVLGIIFGALHLRWVGELLTGTAIYSIIGPVLYTAFKAVLGVDEAAVAVPPPAPEPPAA